MYFNVPPAEEPDHPPPTPRPASPQQFAKAYALAADLRDAGTPTERIQQELLQAGYPSETVTVILNDLCGTGTKPTTGRRARRSTPALAQPAVVDLQRQAAVAGKESGRHKILVGALWFGSGAAVTLLTCAASANGGVYLLAWGPMIYGAIQFFRGLAESSGGGD